MNENQVKPCPFCGGEPRVTRRWDDGAMIRCSKCPATMDPEYKLSIPAIVEIWNRRARKSRFTSDKTV